MERILMLRQRLKRFYNQYDLYLVPLMKFIVMFTVLILLNRNLGYMEILTKWTVMLIIALLCSLLPWSVGAFAAACCLLGHLYALSWEAAVLALIFFFLAAMLHYIFLPGYSIVIALIPAAYFLHIPYLVPLVLGLVGGVTSFIPAGLGVFFYYFIICIQKNAAFLAEATAEQSDILLCFTQILSGLLENDLMILSILAFCVTVLLVYGISKLSFDYAPYIAVAAGAIVNIFIFLLGGFIANVTVPYVEVFVAGLISLGIAVIVLFWIVALDYSRTEYLQYEDDDYVYFVKAVPKIAVTEPDRKIKEINSREEDEDADIEELLETLEKENR